MFKKSDPFLLLIRSSLLAALVGLAAGLGMGLVIWAITSGISTSDSNLPPIELASFLGMGIGTVIGAILGGISALKK